MEPTDARGRRRDRPPPDGGASGSTSTPRRTCAASTARARSTLGADDRRRTARSASASITSCRTCGPRSSSPRRRDLARTVEDVLARRVPLLLVSRDQGLGVCERVAAQLATIHGWDAATHRADARRVSGRGRAQPALAPTCVTSGTCSPASGIYGASFVIALIAGLFPIASVELFLVGLSALEAPVDRRARDSAACSPPSATRSPRRSPTTPARARSRTRSSSRASTRSATRSRSGTATRTRSCSSARPSACRRCTCSASSRIP